MIHKGNFYLVNRPSMREEYMETIQVNLHPDHEERGGDWREIAEKLHEAQKMKKHFAVIELQLLSDLKTMSDGKSSKSGNYVFTSIDCRANIDYNLIPQLADVDLEVYRKPRIQKWKLTKI